MGQETRTKRLFREAVTELEKILTDLSPQEGSKPATGAPSANSPVQGPFGSGLGSFEQWLKLVFLPRAKQIAHSDEALPQTALLGEVADRTIGFFDENPLHRRVSDLLKRIDLLCEGDLPGAMLSLIGELLARKGTPIHETEEFLKSTRQSLEPLPVGEQIEHLETLIKSLSGY